MKLFGTVELDNFLPGLTGLREYPRSGSKPKFVKEEEERETESQ